MAGAIEVIVGGMYSGKTEELIRRLRRAQFARQKIQVFKPKIDNRYSESDVTSHNQNSIESRAVEGAQQILGLIEAGTQVVGVDEAQFFDQELTGVVAELASRGIRVLVAGLDTDWQARPFEPLPAIMAIAEEVTKQHAVCMVCGASACRTQRVAPGDQRIEIGGLGMYEARCREHFVPEVQRPWHEFNQIPVEFIKPLEPIL